MRLGVRIASIIIVIAAGLLLLLRTGAPGRAGATAQPGPVDASVQAQTTVKNVRRAGINLGIWTSWGAEQISSNILKNPGFEGMVDRAIVIVHSVDGRSFLDDQSWTARANGFWANAICDVRTGSAAGRQTRIVNSTQVGRFGLPQFEIADDLALAAGDVVVLTRVDDTGVPANWWIPPDAAAAVGVDRNHRPGSGGARSISLRTRQDQSTEIISYLDMITNRAGKMLPVNGKWRLSFWSAAPDGGASLTARFFRQGASAFVQKTITPGLAWEQETIDFTAEDTGPPGPLELHFQASGAGGRVLVDDVELRSLEDDTAFRKPAVEALASLHPGFLRDWEGQLGDTFDNRVADIFARRTSRYRPGDNNSSDFLYSLPEFLGLCRKVGADPWIVAPVTFSDSEWDNFGRLLGAEYRKGGFTEMLVEFGNENWNQMFRFAGIPDPRGHGLASTRAFQLIRQAAGADVALKFVINGQHANPSLTKQFLTQASGTDIVAIAPYFFPSLLQTAPLQSSYHDMFQGDSGRLKDIAAAALAAGKETAVYEVNINTLEGDAHQAQRDSVVAGSVAASALAKTLLDAYANGVSRQCVYAFSGFDVYLSQATGYTRLFGLTRDFGQTGRFRPTGLAVALLNRVAQGEYHPVAVAPSDSGVSAYSFRSENGWSVALVSSTGEPQQVTIRLPEGGQDALPARMYRIDGDTPEATNEDTESVRIVEEKFRIQGATISVEVPGWAFAVLTPRPFTMRGRPR